jgi:hypothetical protein
MHQLLMVAIGFMVSQTAVTLGWVWPALHWFIGMLTLFAVVRWEVREVAKLTAEVLERIRRKQIEDTKPKQ